VQLCESVFEEKVESVVKQLFEEKIKDKDLKKFRSDIYKNQFQKTKKRWFNSLLNSIENTGQKNKKTKKTELLKEIEMAEIILQEHGLEGFKSLYKANSVDELIEKRIEEVRSWCENTDQKLIDYRYIKDKTINQQQKALTVDICLILTTFLLSELNSNGTIYLEYTDKLEENAIFAISRGKMKFSSTPILIEGEEYYVNEYTPSKDYSLRTLVDKDVIEEGKYRSELLDEIDELIFHVVMSHRTLDFVSNRKIYVDVYSIMKQVYSSKSAKLLDTIERRIQKMSYLKFTATKKGKEQDYVIFGIFDTVRKETGPNGERILEITVNDVLHQELIGQQVTRIYKEVLNKLENRLAKTIIFSLQKERLRAHLNQKNKGVFTYEFFLFRMRFRTKDKNKNIAMIEECLEEIKRHNVTIKDFKRVGNEFHVEFLPVSEQEINDLLPISKNNPPLTHHENEVKLIENEVRLM
jgi:hypothetical protein